MDLSILTRVAGLITRPGTSLRTLRSWRRELALVWEYRNHPTWQYQIARFAHSVGWEYEDFVDQLRSILDDLWEDEDDDDGE